MNFTPEQILEQRRKTAEARAFLALHGDTKEWWELCDEEEQHSLDQAEFKGEA